MNMHEFLKDVEDSVKEYIEDVLHQSIDFDNEFLLEYTDEEFADEVIDNLEDIAFDLVDDCIPVYDSELLEILESDLGLGYVDNYDSPSEITSVYIIIAHNLFIVGTEHMNDNIKDWCIEVFNKTRIDLDDTYL